MNAKEDSDALARLEAAGLVAPIVRGMEEKTLRRRVRTYDRETGEPVRDVTVRELVGGLAKVTALEVEVIEGKRPKEVLCKLCGKMIQVQPNGAIPVKCQKSIGGCKRKPSTSQEYCKLCGKSFDVDPDTGGPRPMTCPSSIGGCHRQTTCHAGCGSRPSKNAFAPSSVARRRGGPWVCSRCHETRPRKSRKDICACGRTKLISSRVCSKCYSTELSLRGPEAAKKMNRSKTPEERSVLADKMNQKNKLRPREDFALWARKGAESRFANATAEQRSESALKAWETRRAKKAESTDEMP